MMKSNCTVMKDCGLYRVVCTDYDRDEYLPSVFINESGERVIEDVQSGRSVDDPDAEEFMDALRARGFIIGEEIQR